MIYIVPIGIIISIKRAVVVGISNPLENRVQI